MNELHAPESICLLSLGPIGDAVLTTRLIHTLAEHLSPSPITVIAGPRNRAVFDSCRAVDEVLVIRNSFAGIADSVGLIAGRGWDLYIDPKDHSSTTSRMLAALLRYRIGLLHPTNVPAFRSTIILPPADGPHFVDSSLTPLAALELPYPDRRTPILPEMPRNEISGQILLNISAGDVKRMWNTESWKELIEMLAEAYDADVAVISAPADSELAENIVDGTRGRRIVTPDLTAMFRAVAASDLVVTPDTSVVHVASAYGIPTVALFSSDRRNMLRFAPLSEPSRTVTPDHGEDAIGAIRVPQVMSAVGELVSEIGAE